MIKSFFAPILFFAGILFISNRVAAQQVVFNEDFSTAQSSNYTTSGPIGSSIWTVARSGQDFGARISGGMMTLTNDATSASNPFGWVSATTATTNFDGTYNPILNQNAGIVSWTFNMQQIRTNPRGFDSGQYGVAFILAGTPGSNISTGKGWAIQLGNLGTTDPIRLVTYSNGLKTFSTKLSSKASGFTDFGKEYTSARVDYNPADNRWTLYLRKDGSAFQNPKSSTLTFQETGIGADFVNEPLTIIGGYWSAATTRNQTALFDNISVSVQKPEIISIDPDSKIAGSAAFTMTVNGSGFLPGSKVQWNGQDRPTTYVSATKLTTVIPASDLILSGTANVQVKNNAVLSNTVIFDIEPSGAPTLTLSKNSLPTFNTTQGMASSKDTYTISGNSLKSGATLTAPSPFEMSVGSSTSYFNPLVLPNSGGGLTGQPLTINVRVKATAAAGVYSGNITNSATGAVTKLVAVNAKVLATEPPTAATAVNFKNITSTSMTVNWTNGNGSERIVLIKEAAVVNALPVDGTNYTANAGFGKGSEIGTGNFVIYKGSGSSVTVNGLNPSIMYHVSVIEFNGPANAENYRTFGAIGSQLTLNSPAGLQVKFSNTSYKIDFDSTVDGVNLDTFQGIGMSNIVQSGQLDSNSWAFSGFSGGNIAFGGNSLEDSSYENGPSDGEEDDTGIYAFNVGADTPNYTLGIQPGGTDFNSETVTLRIQNQTGGTITSVNVGYKVYVFNDQAVSSRIRFGYNSSATGTYTDQIIADVVSPAAADLAPGWKAYYRSVTIPTGNIANNSYYYIRWSGSLVSGSGAQDEFAIDDIEVIAGTELIPITNFASFDGNAEDFVLQGNAGLSNDLSIQNRLLFNGGILEIKDKTLTIAGNVTNTTMNGLTGGGNSKLVVRGTQNPSLSFDVAANSLKVLDLFGANANKVTLLTNIAVNDSLKVNELQTLDLGTNTLTGSLSYIINNGTILTQNISAAPFTSGKVWGGTGILNMNAISTAQTLVAGTYNNLTLSSAVGTTAIANVTVNGKLDLPAPNASATKGSLSMSAFTLTMGENGTNTGVGEVSGIIRRNSFTTNKLYTFGHPNSSITFPSAGTLPTSMSAKLTLGSAPSWRTGAILRQFDIIQTGGSGTKAIIRQHYLDSELNGNTETKLVFWGHNVTGAVDFEQGKSSNNITDNWVEISNANVAQYFEAQFGKVFITLDDTQGVGQIVWNGSVSDSWTTIDNWTPKVKPGETTKVIIPAGMPNYPTLNPEETIGSLLIETGGIVNGISTVESPTPKLFLTLGSGAWQNYGTFNPGAASTIIFNNLDATISGSTTFTNITIPAGGGIRPSEGNYMSIAGTLSNSGTMFTTLIPNTIEFNGSNQVIPNVNGLDFGGYHNLIVSGTGASFAPTINTLNIRGNLTLNQEIPFTGTTINMAGVSDQIIGGTATTNFNNLTVNKETGAVVLAQDIAVNGTLTLTKGNVVLGTNNLTLGSNAVAGTFDVNTMIVADGSGLVRRPFSSVLSYFFPIGENTGAPSYSPITVNVTAGTFSNAFVGVNAKNVKNPSNNSSQNYLRKYWNVTQSGITGATATITAKYETLDVRGTEAEISAAQLNGTFNQSTNPWIKFAPLANNTLTAEGVILTSGQTSVFTGLKAGDFSVEVYGYGEFCQGSEAVLSAEIVGGDAPYTYFWSNGLPNSQNVTVPTTAVGDITYTLTVRDANGFVAVDNNSPVKVLAASVGGRIENSTQEICAGTVPNDLQLIESVGKVLYWQMSETLDFAKFTNISNFTTTLTGADLGPLNQTTYIRAVVESGNCGQAFSNIVTILIKSTTWTGTTWTSDLPNNLTSAIFAADYNTSSHGAITACGCTVESGIKLTVASGTTMILQNDIINNGNITVESDANLIQLSSTGKYTGDPLGFKVQRVANIKRLDYVYWSSPVTGQKLKGFSPGTLNNRFLTYNEWNDKFTAVPDVNASFHPAKGYAIRASNSQPVSATDWMGNFVGTPNNGEIPFALELTTAGNGYNLVGNPYPSNINFDYLVNDESNSNSIYSLAYFWTNTNANGPMQGSGYPKDGLINNYAIYNGTGGVPATGPATNETPENPIPAVSLPRPDGIILVGQAFIVKAKKVGDLKFQNNIKVSVPGKFIDKGSSVDRFWLNLTTPLKVQTTTLIGYKASATNGFELDYDAPLMVLGADALYSILDDRRLSIQGRAAFVNTDLISLGTNHYEAGTYTISLGHTEGIFANGQNIYLKDKQTGTVTNLSVTDYMFTVDKGLTEGRFEIVFKADTVLGTDSSRKESLIVYRDGADFVVRSQTKKITGVEVYDTGGRLVYSLTAHAMQVVVPAEQLPNSVYILKIMQSETSTSRKILK